MRYLLFGILIFLVYSCDNKSEEPIQVTKVDETILEERQARTSDHMKSIMDLVENSFESDPRQAQSYIAKALLYMNALPIYYFDSFIDKSLAKKDNFFHLYSEIYIEYFHRELVLKRPESEARFDIAIKKKQEENYKSNKEKYLLVKSKKKNGYYEISPNAKELFENIFFSDLGKEFINSLSPSSGNFLNFASSVLNCYECTEDALEALLDNNYEENDNACNVVKSLVNEGMFSKLDDYKKKNLHKKICDSAKDILDGGFGFGNCMLNAMQQNSTKNSFFEQTKNLENFFKCLNDNSTNVALRNNNLNFNVNYYSQGGRKFSRGPLASDDDIFDDVIIGGKIGKDKLVKTDKGEKYSFKSDDGELQIEKFTPVNGKGKSITHVRNVDNKGKIVNSYITTGPNGLAGISYTVKKNEDGDFVVTEDLFNSESETFKTQEEVDKYLEKQGIDPELYKNLDNNTTPNPEIGNIPAECLDAWNKAVGKRSNTNIPGKGWTDPSPDDAVNDLGIKEMFEAIKDCMSQSTNFVVKCDQLIRCPEESGCPCSGQYYTDASGLKTPCYNAIDCGPDQYLNADCSCVEYGQIEGVLPTPVRGPLLGKLSIDL